MRSLRLPDAYPVAGGLFLLFQKLRAFVDYSECCNVIRPCLVLLGFTLFLYVTWHLSSFSMKLHLSSMYSYFLLFPSSLSLSFTIFGTFRWMDPHVPIFFFFWNFFICSSMKCEHFPSSQPEYPFLLTASSLDDRVHSSSLTSLSLSKPQCHPLQLSRASDPNFLLPAQPFTQVFHRYLIFSTWTLLWKAKNLAF